MQQDPRYADVVAEVQATFCRSASPRCAGGGHRARAHRHRPGLRLRQDAGTQSRRCCARLREFAALGRAGARRLVAQVLARARSPAGPRASAWRRALPPLCSRSQNGASNPARARRGGDARRASRCWQAVEQGMSQKIFRHRRHPRHGRAERRSRRISCCAWAMPRARCCAGQVPGGMRPAVLIGKDTRISGYMLEASLEAGFLRRGRRRDAVGPDADARRSPI